ncbi:hypothetical protein [Leptospira weilii]|uniref:hypothetical protein n=1 Tax=Leptospira weilii TaxID=28184 RepID=UPI001F1D15B2|nr:hypothetical protein [Leptospira weilii]
MKPTFVKGKGNTEDFFFFHWLFIPTNTHETLFKLLIIASTILLKIMESIIMNSCLPSSHFPWFWVCLFENLLLYLLYKIPLKKVFDLFTLLVKKVKALFNTKKQIGRPLEYWKIYVSA